MPAPEQAAHPTQLGPYRIDSPLGEGGMGEVFKAYDTRLHRTVAIKILRHEKISDPDSRRQFLQEARAASALNHSNIVTVHDIDSDNGVDYLVMELIPGKTLKQMIPPEGLPFAEVAGYGAQVAQALATAHAAGIVHRDIKPANIMVTPEGQVKVLDFGIARQTAFFEGGPQDETQTAFAVTLPGMVAGTIAYMSPEQTRGERVDSRSDIFSLGCSLYEAATGRHPFPGENALAIMHAIATVHPPPPSSVKADLPVGFDRLIAACLEKNPADRYRKACETATELKLLLRPDIRTEPAATGCPSVAVVPFVLRTGGGGDHQFLSVALADAVIHRLAALEKLRVRPISSMLRYKDAEVEWTRVARELCVDLVVQGTIQTMGAKVRVLVQVFRLSDSIALHSSKHDGDLEDLFGLQDRIAEAVSEVFVSREKVGRLQSETPPTAVPLAYELYLRAVDRLAHMDKFDTGLAIEILERVVDLDPNFADAWGRLAQACTQMGMHLDPDPQWFVRADRAIGKTLDLDPVQCDALCARAQILWSPLHGFRNRAALRAVNASVKINATREISRFFRAAVLFHLGFYAESDRDLEYNLLANPTHAMSTLCMGTNAIYRGDFERAEHLIERSLALNPAIVHGNLFFPLVAIYMGRLGVARERIGRARQLFPDEAQLVSLEGLVLAHEGNFRLAEEAADRAVSINRSLTHTHHTWHDAAGIYAICGKPEKAIAQLRRCGEMGLPNYLLFRRDPHLRSLRGNADFETLMTKLLADFRSIGQEFDLRVDLKNETASV